MKAGSVITNGNGTETMTITDTRQVDTPGGPSDDVCTVHGWLPWCWMQAMGWRLAEDDRKAGRVTLGHLLVLVIVVWLGYGLGVILCWLLGIDLAGGRW